MTTGSTFPSPRAVLESLVAPVLARFPAPPLPFSGAPAGARLFVAAANHLIAQSGWAAGRLRPFAGRHAQVVLGAGQADGRGGMRFPFSIGADGLLAATGNDTDIPADVTLRLPGDALTALTALPGGGLEAVLGRVQVSGAADLAETLGFVFRQLRWDGEADLARLVGDIPAHRLSRLAGQAVTWQREAGQRLLANGTEYLVEERGLLPAKGELAVFGHDVDRLRDDLARLEKRLQRLNEQSRSK